MILTGDRIGQGMTSQALKASSTTTIFTAILLNKSFFSDIDEMKSFPMMNMILLDKRVLSNHYNYVQCTSALHFTVNSNLSRDFNHKAMA